MTRTVKTLLFSTLYPSAARPLHGVFVETRLRELLRRGGVETKVVAPVPWFWSTKPRFGRYARVAATARHECHNGIEVFHPRYFLLPKIGMSSAPFALALGAFATLAAIRRDGFDFEVIDAHYYYPDGVAAAMLAAWFDRPLVVTARGTDVNLIAQYTVPRSLIRWAARQASASIGVSAALVERMGEIGLDPSRLLTMSNGVDLERFDLRPAERMREQLSLQGGPLILTVGNLHEHKGQRLVLEAFSLLQERLEDARLVIVGEGPDREVLHTSIERAGLRDRVRLVGAIPNEDLASWYGAADVTVLASSREGWPNVLLESMACGTPVVASSVGGVPEIIQDLVAGRIVSERSADGFASAIEHVLHDPPDRRLVRAYAERFSWDRTSRSQLALFRSLAAQPEATSPCGSF
ncbi:MAG: putative teichuronic acid biosynthesis glycosyltransferase TuaC [Burkholderiaceae bacterium]|nr:putative teichuronic acid biosynthesis glycosyltransferase TuaC [Burkholderiaceae bacterium]